LKQSTSITGAGAVNQNQTETGSAPLSLPVPAPAHSLIYIPEQFRAKYQALKNELNVSKKVAMHMHAYLSPKITKFRARELPSLNIKMQYHDVKYSIRKNAG
jgi:hypothetical protein